MNRSQSIFLFLAVATVVVVGLIAARPSDGTSLPDRTLPILALTYPVSPPATPTLVQDASNRQLAAAATSTVISPPPVAETGTTPDSVYAVYASQLQVPQPNTSPGATGVAEDWNPPPAEVPLARHPFDHYWLLRPVASNSNNFGLPHYAYGSDGPADDLRIHHGIDLANPIGVEVLAAGDGVVVAAGKGHITEDEAITAYGNTVVIQHDFGYNGQPIFTLYAHLSALLVEEGERVEAGQVIGLIGNTGQVSGPHVHFEVRIAHDRYSAVRNPDLWIAPYIGRGVIAGRVADENGQWVADASITLIDRTTGEAIYRTSTYAGPSVNSDDNWQENFTIPDIPAGQYLVTARHEQGVWAGIVEVVPGMTNWVELTRSQAIPGASPTSTP